MILRQVAEQHDGECPPGYSGDDCSIAVVACAAKRIDLVDSCYHGSICIDASNDAGLIDRYCACDQTEVLTAGLMCEYRVTSVCTTTENVLDQYCVNGGLCKLFVKGSASHPGCICKTGMWEGEHCEFSHGTLIDDALDMFHERKIEFENDRLAGRISSKTEVRTTELAIGNAGSGEDKEMPLFLAVGLAIALLMAFSLFMIAIRVLRKRPSQACDDEYDSISFSSIALSKSTHENSSPPPLNMFLSSFENEVDLAEEKSLMFSPRHGTHDFDSDNVELLDAETSRMIEVQFENHKLFQSRERTSFGLSHEDRAGSNFSYDIDDYESNMNQIGMQHGRIIINCGKPGLPTLQSESSPFNDDEDDFDALIGSSDEMYETDVHEKDESGSIPCHSGGVTDDDSDEDTHFA